VTALFGPGDDARRTLVHAWLDDARRRMKEEAAENMGIGDVLKARLRSNEPVLEHLPEVIDILHIDIQVDCSSPSCKKIVF
jgi:ubiquinone biosynthesis protein COQ9